MVTFVILKFYFGCKVENRKKAGKQKHEGSLWSYSKCLVRNDGGVVVVRQG